MDSKKKRGKQAAAIANAAKTYADAATRAVWLAEEEASQTEAPAWLTIRQAEVEAEIKEAQEALSAALKEI